MLSRAAAAVVAALLLAGPAAAQSPTLSLEGKVKQPKHFTIDDLKKMPAEHADVSYQTDRGPVTASFTSLVAGDLGRIFHNSSKRVCEITAAHTAP